MNEIKPIIVKKNVKHNFTPEEVAALNVDFRNAYQNLKSVEAEFDNVKAVWKAKVTESESRMETLSATLNAGFEMRTKECAVIFRPADKKKDFVLIVEGDEGEAEAGPIIATEDMTDDDFHQDLVQAESCFDHRKELDLWEAGSDHGRLIIGNIKGRWFSALRCNVGAQEIVERLDSEQMSFKARHDAIKRAAKRCSDWLKDTVGKDAAKGFDEKITAIVEAEKEKAE